MVALATLAAACGDSEPTPEQQVRTTLTDFGRAITARDYQALCDRIFAPALVEQLSEVGLPCEVAMQQSFEDVEEPKLTIGAITVADDEKSARAQVRSSAKGQRPSEDTVELVPVEGTWRISSLGE